MRKKIYFFLLLAALSRGVLAQTNTFPTSGNVGVGISTPSFPLDVATTSNVPARFTANTTSNSWVLVGNSTGSMNLGIGAANPYAYIWSGTGHFFIGDDGGATLYVNGMNNGSVGIGTINTGSNKLAVEGTIGARKIVVTQTSPFPDYVFDEGYKTPSLDSVAAYIKTHHHLPEVASADSVSRSGLDLGGNQVVLLKKIEELTLYIIEQNKQLDEQRNRSEKQDKIMANQQEKIDRLEKLVAGLKK